jgi:hypothetical protein
LPISRLRAGAFLKQAAPADTTVSSPSAIPGASTAFAPTNERAPMRTPPPRQTPAQITAFSPTRQS